MLSCTVGLKLGLRTRVSWFGSGSTHLRSPALIRRPVNPPPEYPCLRRHPETQAYTSTLASRIHDPCLHSHPHPDDPCVPKPSDSTTGSVRKLGTLVKSKYETRWKLEGKERERVVVVYGLTRTR